MLRHLGIFLLAIVLSLGLFGLAYAGHDNGKGNGGVNNGKGNGKNAPELDPMALGSGILVLAGGMLLLNERRRLGQINE